jgi:hypothetical protein
MIWYTYIFIRSYTHNIMMHIHIYLNDYGFKIRHVIWFMFMCIYHDMYTSTHLYIENIWYNVIYIHMFNHVHMFALYIYIYVHVYMGWWFSFVMFDFIVVGFIKINPKNVIQTNKIIWHQQAKYHKFQTFQYTCLLYSYDILILNKKSQSNTKFFNTYT